MPLCRSGRGRVRRPVLIPADGPGRILTVMGISPILERCSLCSGRSCFVVGPARKSVTLKSVLFSARLVLGTRFSIICLLAIVFLSSLFHLSLCTPLPTLHLPIFLYSLLLLFLLLPYFSPNSYLVFLFVYLQVACYIRVDIVAEERVH